jgi:hypothetical protein
MDPTILPSRKPNILAPQLLNVYNLSPFDELPSNLCLTTAVLNCLTAPRNYTYLPQDTYASDLNVRHSHSLDRNPSHDQNYPHATASQTTTTSMASITASRAPTSAQPDVSSTHPYTCNTCQVAFRNSELQRGHMRSDWQ